MLSTVGVMNAESLVETSTAENPKYYVIASYDRGGYLTLPDVNAGTAAKHDDLADGSYWYFETAENGAVYFVNKQKKDGAKVYLGSNRTASPTASAWYVLENGLNDEGFSISSTAQIADRSCLDAGNDKAIGTWNPGKNGPNDWNGTTWKFLAVDDIYDPVYNPNSMFFRSRTDRKVASITLNSCYSEKHSANTTTLDHSKNTAYGLAYIDLTETVTMKAAVGETVTASFARNGDWTNTYVYIDKDNDGFTASVADDKFTPQGDLMSFSFYTTLGGDNAGYNSAGENLSGNNRNTIELPEFKMPTTPGIYRMRFKLDWNSIDPNGTKGADSFMSVGGTIIDVNLEVVDETIYTLKYSFTYDGIEKMTQVQEVLHGASYPEITTTFPWGVKTPSKPDGTVVSGEAVAGVITKEIPLTLADGILPFVAADSYANITNWYYMPIHANKYYLSYTEDQTSIPLTDAQKVLPANGEGHDAYLWAFVGNPFDGYMIFNKAAGSGKILSSSTTMTGTNGGGTYAIMTQTPVPNGNNTYWIPTASNQLAGFDGFFLEQKGYTNNKLNARNVDISQGKLAYWSTGKDGGSTFRVTTLAATDDFNMMESLRADAGKVGYPKDANALNGLAQNQSTKLDVAVAIKAYKTNRDIVLPEDGKAYIFMNVMGNNERTQRYMKYVNGQKLAVSTDVNDASVFVCKKLREGVYAFVTADGKVLTWVGNDEGGAYKEGTNIYGYSSYYATAFGGKSDWNEITVKKDATEANAYGQLRLVGRRKSTAFSSFIVNTADRFDQAGDARLFDASNSSAWILTEVEHTNNDAQNLALARVNAKNAIGSRTFGEGTGKYHYVADGVNVYTLNVDEIATVDDINAALATVAINQPATGFYRIKSMNGNDANKKGRFLEVNATGTKLVKDGTNPDNKYTSVFYIKDNTILSYSCGQYLNAYKTFATIGAEPTAWVIKENAAIVGTYALQYEENSGHNGYLSDWLPIPAATEENPVPVFEPTNGLNDANAAWTLEEVTWLPVPMNAEIGWATFYSPVQLALSDNRVNAYAGKVNGQYVTLNTLTSVPAETGVILELNTNDALEDGCVFLEVEKTSLTDVDTDLDGTFDDTYVEEESYVLSAPDGVESVGLYKAKKNFVNNEGTWTKADKGTHFLNNGFKAYLPVVSEARFFVFDFGTETAIEGVEGENGNVKTEIYDLAGRRVQNAQKGVFIVNGKVVVK